MQPKLGIGIVGYGFVGRATAYLFERTADIIVHDSNPDRVPITLCFAPEIGDLTPCDIVFVCVPTPMKPDGSCDTSIVESVVRNLSQQRNNIIAIRSTVPPGFTEFLQKQYAKSSILFCPEFLTEANWKRDIDDAPRVVVGGAEIPAAYVMSIFYSAYRHTKGPSIPGFEKSAMPHMPIFALMRSTEAELGKLMANGMCATKVSFSNEVYALAQKLGIDYDQVRFVAASDTRIGPHHTQVLGPDGHAGFGGTCIPKDLNNLIHAMKANGVKPSVAEAVWETNLRVRENKDWLKLKGRAVTE